MWKLIFFVIALITGVVHGVFIEPSFNILVSWILIGIWLDITIATIGKSKQHSEYNSPHNTAFFTIVPMFIGLFYSMWSNFTGLLGDVLFDYDVVSIDWWSLILSFPYIVYGIVSIRKMFKKYLSVYFGTKAVKSRGFGYFISFSVYFVIIGYWTFFYIYMNDYEILLEPINFQINAFLIMVLILVGIIFFVNGIFGKRVSFPPISRDYITNRARSIDETLAPIASATSSQAQFSSIPRASNRSSRSSSRTSRPSRVTAQARPKQQKVKSRSKGRPSPRSQKTVSQSQYAKLKPKGVNLTQDDFKCIFCFELPKTSDNNHGGIVICPECRYPAHYDEFKDWTRNSQLCSRCDAPLPLRYIRNPKVIPTSEYLKVIKMFAK